MADNIVKLPYGYYPDPTKGRPVFNGSVFIGEPDTDPEIEVNRKTVTLQQEDGTLVPILPAGQPLLTGAGGVILFEGSPVVVLVNGDHSLKVLNNQGSQVYFSPGIASDVEDTDNLDDLRDITGQSDGDIVRVKGHTASGDKGGGLFLFDENATDSDDNGITIAPLSGGGRWIRQFDGPVHVIWFSGDTEVDHTTAITTAITNGSPLEWDDFSYTVVSTITLTITGDLNWHSDGATVQMVAAIVKKSIFDFSSTDNENVHSITGVFTLDCNDDTHGGFILENISSTPANYPDEHSTLLIEDMVVKNILKTEAGKNLGFINGDGIFIRGAFVRVAIVRAIIDRVVMEANAGVSLVHGITGITVSDDNEGSYTHDCYIEDVYINDIFSNDPTKTDDQDGIRLFTDRGVGAEHTQSSFTIRGGTVRNSRNRSVKLQTQTALIDGLTIIKDSSVDISSAGITQNPDIDMQTGGGTVQNVEFYYDNFVGIEMIRYDEDSTGIEIVPSLTVNGVIGVFTQATTGQPDAIVKPFSDSTRNQMTVSINNIQVVGKVLSAVDARVNGPGTVILNMNSVYADVVTQFLDMTSSGDCISSMLNCHNTGSSLVEAFTAASGNPDQRLSLLNCTGFLTAARVNLTETMPNTTRVDSITTNVSGDAGLIRPFSITIADGATTNLEKTGFSNGNHILIMQVARGAGLGSDSGMFSITNGASGDVISANGGAIGGKYSIGNGVTDPGGGTGVPNDYVLWASVDSSTGVNIRNASGASRLFTGVMIG